MDLEHPPSDDNEQPDQTGPYIQPTETASSSNLVTTNFERDIDQVSLLNLIITFSQDHLTI